VVILASEERVHEMLCRSLANEFDNRMLQVKKQLRVVAGGLELSFPLLYSKFIRDEISGRPTRTPQPPAAERPAKYQQERPTIDSNFSTPSRR